MNNPRAFPNTNATIPPEGDYWNYQGMTLRDYMAAKAMQSLLSDKETAAMMVSRDLIATSEYRREFISDVAYKMADAMLKARES